MLSAALNVGNDNVEGAPRNSPLESAVLIVIVLWEPGCHHGRRAPEPTIGRRRTTNAPCCWHPIEGGVIRVRRYLLSVVVESPHLFYSQTEG
jgi:hypothetical protein